MCFDDFPGLCFVHVIGVLTQSQQGDDILDKDTFKCGRTSISLSVQYYTLPITVSPLGLQFYTFVL